MHVEEKNNGAKTAPKTDNHFTTAEKAQYEVFRTGGLPREQIEEWIKNDLRAVQSFVHGCLNDPEIWKAIVDAYYLRYTKLHQDVESTPTKTGS